ncbi:MAG: hypothetical protein R3B90_03525 [Planctomycetaceae bacterium]
MLDYVIDEKWEYVFQSDLVSVDTPAGFVNPILGVASNHYDTIGVNQYLFYNVTDNVRAGGRLGGGRPTRLRSTRPPWVSTSSRIRTS